MVRPFLVLIIYFIYAFLIANDPHDIKYVGFRAVRFIMALAVLNYIVYKKINIIEELFHVLKWLTLHGIANFIVVNFLFRFFAPVPGTNTFSLLLFFGSDSAFYSFHRNQSIFWEPGVFQIYLNIFLFINLFYRENKFPVLVIIAVILSTVSTTGVVISFLQILYYYIVHLKMSYKKILIIVLIAPALFGYYIITKNIVEDKLIGTSKGSFWSRSFDTENGFAIAFNNPLGIGFSTVKYQKIAASNVYNVNALVDTDRGNTNSIATLFYSTGLFFGILFLIFLFRQQIFPRYKFLMFLIMIFCLSSEPLFFSTFFLIFPLSGMLGENHTTKKGIIK